MPLYIVVLLSLSLFRISGNDQFLHKYIFHGRKYPFVAKFRAVPNYRAILETLEIFHRENCKIEKRDDKWHRISREKVKYASRYRGGAQEGWIIVARSRASISDRGRATLVTILRASTSLPRIKNTGEIMV